MTVLEGQLVGVNYNHADNDLNICHVSSPFRRSIHDVFTGIPKQRMLLDRITRVPSIHLKDATFNTFSLETSKGIKTSGWVTGTVVDLEEPTDKTGERILFSPSSRPDFYFATTGERIIRSPLLSINGSEMYVYET